MALDRCSQIITLVETHGTPEQVKFIKGFFACARGMRRRQIEYFRLRSTESLKKAKQAEDYFDDCLNEHKTLFE